MAVRFTKVKKQAIRAQEMTIDEAFQKFMIHNEAKNLTNSSIKYYRENYGYFIECIDANLPISQVCIEDVEAFSLYLRKHKNRKDTSINTAIRATRSFLYFCMDRGYMKRFRVTIAKADQTFKEPYTQEELQKLLKRPTSDQWTQWRTWALVSYLVSTGHRASTVINLKVKDIDLHNNRIKLTHTKNRRSNFMPMASSLRDVLKEYLALWDYEPEDYLFPNRKGQKMSVSSLQNIIRRYNVSRGVEKTGVHLFRHTFAREYVVRGGDMARLQMLLGHTTLDMTKKYIMLYSKDLETDFDKFNPLNRLIK